MSPRTTATLATVAVPVAAVGALYRFAGTVIESQREILGNLDISVGILSFCLTLGSATWALVGRRLGGRNQPVSRRRSRILREASRLLEVAFGPGARALEGVLLLAFVTASTFVTWAVLVADLPLRSLVDPLIALALGVAIAMPTLLRLGRRVQAVRTITRAIGSFGTREIPRVRHAYEKRLKEILDEILAVSSYTPKWRRLVRSYTGPTAILFAPDQARHCFVPVAVSSAVRSFEETIVWKRMPPFLEVDKLCAAYNRHYLQASGHGADEISSLERVRQFRRDTEKISSTSAVVAGLARPFVFSGVYRRCLTFDFSFLNEIEHADDQRRLRFEHLVGIPARFNGRLFGVLLLLSDTTTRFVEDDQFYEQFMDQLGHALYVGKLNGSLPSSALTALENPPQFMTPQVKDFRKLIRQMNPSFSTPLDENLIARICDDEATSDYAGRIPSAATELRS